MVVLDVSMERSKQNVCDEHTLCLLAESTAEVLPEGYQDKASWTRLSEVAAHPGGRAIYDAYIALHPTINIKQVKFPSVVRPCRGPGPCGRAECLRGAP